MINDKAYRHKNKTIFMNAACPIGKGRDQKRCQQHMHFFTRKYIAEHTVNCNWPCKGYKGIENNVDIIIPEAEYIYKRKKLNEHITFQIIPPGIIRGKKASKFTFISTMKNIGKVF